MTPCTTLEQRRSACRAPRFGALRDAESQEQFEAINLALDACGVPDAEGYDNGCDTASRHWGIALAAPESHRRPCTSPRRRQCRVGTWVAAHHVHCVCPALEIGPVQQRMHVPIVGGRWFQAVFPGD